MTTRITVVVVLVAALPQVAAAQHPDAIAFHAAVALNPGSPGHGGAAVSWRKYVDGSWGVNAEYNASTTGEHSDHIVWVGAVKSLGPPDDVVPYVIIGGAGAYYHTHGRGSGGATWAPGVGVGVTRWNVSRSWYWAPEARFGVNALLTLSVAIGFSR